MARFRAIDMRERDPERGNRWGIYDDWTGRVLPGRKFIRQAMEAEAERLNRGGGEIEAEPSPAGNAPKLMREM